ncbi:histidine kinase dimerization/phospho-acceptor domain-containing protein [Granulicella arctica]|uniref:histidine kinase dimerization/phospho-acceptor domain-containing protein n=1 Tax=Granulicella arctica TaxID=940613 RepID=UPI0021E0902C|nr:histidine kinase dimerization/phospho-acceptor domain-containing protein [Granulicella arctica]
MMAVWALARRRRARWLQLQWTRDRLRELEAYCGLEVSLSLASERDKLAIQAKRVCRMVVEKSVFPKVALLTRNVDGRLLYAGSCGMDDLTLEALGALGDRLIGDENTGKATVAKLSYSVTLGEWVDFDDVSGHGRHLTTIVPLRMQQGRLVGALAVCSDAKTELRMGEMEQVDGIPRALMPLEMLAAKLARTLERGMLMERLMQAERLAGVSGIVADVAHKLLNPLTTVLGFAELIAETSIEARARQDAAIIVAEATRMQETLRGLQDFWKPRKGSDLQTSQAVRAGA